ncbi:MAG: site-specific DNA-methyltransferase [Gammaproteobacteria bacterium]|nr:site-specific DNA-methyltransferase [Gammaproteobacteria bacterium]
MKNSFPKNLYALLKTEPRFIDESGELVKTAVVNCAWKNDSELIQLLLQDVSIRKKFFSEINGHQVFNLRLFIDYVTDKNFLNSSYTRFRNKIGLNINESFLRERGEVSLVWPYKDCVLEGGQTREIENRKEIFFNEMLAQDEIDRLFDPKVLTNWKRYTKYGVWDVEEFKWNQDGILSENLIIKGNNLLALHTIKQQFYGKVKLIYIDPPYNTGTDSFGYNDSFSHSSWLTFMKNRLEVARDLLRDDGLIFMHIGDQEMHYLKIVADEIFGRNNFVGTAPRKTRSGKSDVPYKLSQDFDWLLIYTRGASKKDHLFRRRMDRKYYKSPDFPDNEWRLTDLTKQTTIEERPRSNFTLINPKNEERFEPNPNRSWAISVDTVNDYLKRGKIVFPGDYDFLKITRPYMRVFKSEDMEKKGEDFDKAYVSTDFLNGAMDELLKDMVNKKGTDEIVELFGNKVFAYPKVELLLQRIIEYTTREGDIVLDFHLGSGTTCAVAHKMGRQYIGIEQMDYIEDITVQRLKKVVGTSEDYDAGGISEEVGWQGGGDFIYCELMQYNATWIDKIQMAKSSDELLAIWQDMAQNSFLNWYVNHEYPDRAQNDFIAVGSEKDGLDKQKRLLVELLDKNQLYVNLTEIDDEDFEVSEQNRALNREFFTGEHVDPDEGLELSNEFIEMLEESIDEATNDGKTISLKEATGNLGAKL